MATFASALNQEADTFFDASDFIILKNLQNSVLIQSPDGTKYGASKNIDPTHVRSFSDKQGNQWLTDKPVNASNSLFA